ncbi:hypothetical protein QQS21_009715 [Conoideocrella luteorostrata]|uniref:Uncharacterized protein n=1 Tax=Conoideocrella luteorostrata TaxID=1105319 RepID=A0AAJ0CGP1_9HYPO|nr:hypothetical protein QQS21_009715 [Conoideocrella luteorostrata]
MGLLVEDDEQHSLESYSNGLPTTSEHAKNKCLSFNLIWLLCKLINHLAPLPDADLSRTRADSETTDDFVYLESQFDSWHRNISTSFHPDATFRTPNVQDQKSTGLFMRETWFSNDLCSTTMMYYHMARLLLLIHRPPELPSMPFQDTQGAPFDLIRLLDETKKKLSYHSAEVISIARGTACDAVRLRAIQPLYIAGRCCSSMDDRKRLLEFLAGIQDSLGIATGYRIKELLKEWALNFDDLGMEERMIADT